MKKLFVLINHEMTESQIKEAREVLEVDEIINLSNEVWACIEPNKEKIVDDLCQYKSYLSVEAKKGDYILVQGDFGATYHMVNFAFACGLIPIYATTKRISMEKVVDSKIITVREFTHARFRIYEK
jgi:hypothetical protein